MQTRRFAQRFAPLEVATRYPYPIEGEVSWDSAGDLHEWTLALPDLPADSILVPSFSCIDDTPYAFHFALRSGGECWPLSPIGEMGAKAGSAASAAVSTPIDNFHIHKPLSAATLTLTVRCPRPPQRYLVTVSARPFHSNPPPGIRATPRLRVSPLSQLLAPRQIRRRICSPTCVTMVLRYYGVQTHLKAVAEGCFHQSSGMFGVWPLATITASRHGVIGATELFAGPDDVAPALAAGIPPVASIRYGAGTLPGSPMPASGGHLVVVTGMDSHVIWTNDPAAPDLREVPRAYPREAFARAWFAQRGATYLFVRPWSS